MDPRGDWLACFAIDHLNRKLPVAALRRYYGTQA
jgi:hypothetical protein